MRGISFLSCMRRTSQTRPWLTADGPCRATLAPRLRAGLAVKAERIHLHYALCSRSHNLPSRKEEPDLSSSRQYHLSRCNVHLSSASTSVHCGNGQIRHFPRACFHPHSLGMSRRLPSPAYRSSKPMCRAFTRAWLCRSSHNRFTPEQETFDFGCRRVVSKR